MVNVGASYFHFRLKALSNIYLADSRILYFWQVLEYIHKCIIEFHVLQCLFVRGYNKQESRGRIISNFTKGETFSSLMTTKYSWGDLTMCSPFLAPSKKHLPLPFSLAKKRIYLPGHLIKWRAYWFILKTAWVFHIPTGRIGIGWWTLLQKLILPPHLYKR